MIDVTSLSAYDLSQKLHSGEISSLDLCKAYLDRIKKINELYDDGHIIIFYTARGNKSGRGEEYYGPITRAQLDAWGVKYHELYFKPFDGDIFIDDRSVHPDEFFK